MNTRQQTLTICLFDMESALSFITVLPSNDDELEVFKRQVKSEILNWNSYYIKKQLIFGKKLFDDLLADEDLIKYFEE